jgi:hypothetical protein
VSAGAQALPSRDDYFLSLIRKAMEFASIRPGLLGDDDSYHRSVGVFCFLRERAGRSDIVVTGGHR